MTRILVTWASRHGATADIATAVAGVLADNGLSVEARQMKDVDTLFPYDAFVVGSAVYMGRWLPEARDFVDEHVELLSVRPTWLFSSGPVGTAGTVDEFSAADLLGATHARGHQLFGGKLDRAELRLGERAIAGLMHVPNGDYRDWAAVVAWATAVARVLDPEPASPTRAAARG
jgi:menaquinone-dependent protoporphyrinogen oxidase